MAQLTAEEASPTSVRPIPAHTQLLAVAWLRWRMFVNNFMRRQSGKRPILALAVTILLRIFVWSIFAVLAVGPIAGSGFLGYSAVAHHPRSLIPLLAGIFALWQFVNFMGLGVAASLSSFDPSSLARFPLRFGRYLLLRTLLGLLTPTNIVGSLALLAVAIGLGIANHALALPALIVLAVYAWMNIFFNRMLAAWLERWLAIRRYREIFGVLLTLLSVGLQLLNLQSRRFQHSSPTSNWFLNFINASDSLLRRLPPGFAANAILPQGRPLAQLAQFAALLAATALFLALFAMRLHKQFLGEYPSEGPPRTTPAARSRRLSRPSTAAEKPAPLISPVIAACLRKEWFDLGGYSTQLINLLTPLLFVIVLGKGILDQHPAFFLPAAIAYAIVGLLARLYNIFGADGSGVQLYLLAPIRLRDVVLAKNLVSITLILTEALLAWALVLAIVKTPIALPTQLSVALWLLLVIFTNLTVGTLRSIQSPRKALPAPAIRPRDSSSHVSNFVFLATLLLELPVTLLARYLGLPWLAVFIFIPFTVAALVGYTVLLRRADQLILSHRDLVAEELCKT